MHHGTGNLLWTDEKSAKSVSHLQRGVEVAPGRALRCRPEAAAAEAATCGRAWQHAHAVNGAAVDKIQTAAAAAT